MINMVPKPYPQPYIPAAQPQSYPPSTKEASLAAKIAKKVAAIFVFLWNLPFNAIIFVADCFRIRKRTPKTVLHSKEVQTDAVAAKTFRDSSQQIYMQKIQPPFAPTPSPKKSVSRPSSVDHPKNTFIPVEPPKPPLSRPTTPHTSRQSSFLRIKPTPQPAPPPPEWDDISEITSARSSQIDFESDENKPAQVSASSSAAPHEQSSSSAYFYALATYFNKICRSNNIQFICDENGDHALWLEDQNDVQGIAATNFFVYDKPPRLFPSVDEITKKADFLVNRLGKVYLKYPKSVKKGTFDALAEVKKLIA